jgi:probable F420-dependent oxidoreductase
MKLGQLGVWSPTDAMTAAEAIALAQEVEKLGYSALWYPESRGHEAFSLGAMLLANTDTLILATGIANIYARDPLTAKQGQHTLNKFSGGRFLLGLGVSHVPIVEGLRGHSYGKPVATMRAYLEGMANGAAMAPKLDETPPTVIAALGPNMTRLGREKANGVHPYNITPEQTALAREIVGPEAWVCSEQKVILETSAGTARAAGRANIERYMSLPNYVNNWRRMGFTDDDLSGGGSDRFIDAMYVWGDEGAIRKRIQEHLDAGATHVCIQPVRTDGAPKPDMRALQTLAS